MDRSKIKFSLTFLFILVITFGSQAQSLDSLLMMAVQNNPELKALQLEYEAALEKKNQVSQLANPEIGVGVPILRPETRLGPQIVMIGAKQMFPWFGTFEAKENVTLAMAKVKYERISALKLELFQTIKSAYYDLCLIERKLDIVSQNILICHSMESLALSKVESGKASLTDVLQSQLRIKKHHHELDLLDIDKQTHYSVINTLIQQDVTTPIVVEDNFTEVAQILINLEAYRAKIDEFHPLILQINGKIEASKYAQAVNDKSGKPSFGVGLDYALVNERTDMNPIGNGRDILVAKVMLKIPLYRKKYDSFNVQEGLNQEAFEYQKESVEDKMIGMLRNYQIQYDQTMLHADFIRLQIEIVEQTYEISLSKYSTESANLAELLQLQHDLINYQFELEETIIRTHQISANIDRLTDF